jgi:TonB-dependent receptor
MRPGHAVRPQHSLLARRSLVTLGIWLCLAGSVHAQDNAASDTDTKEKLAEKGKATDLDTVEVRGVRASLIKSQVIKRDSDQIVDSVSAEDIGALPDRSVTETLQRVSGVTIDHFMARNDTDHFSAEGSGVMIRGMTQVRGELNGRDIFSANSGRGLSFEDVPSELMAGVDVYKNPSADIIEGGLGGTVNLRTFKPFDFEGRKIAASVDMNRGDMSKENKPSASFLFSDRWNTGIGEVGALFDVAYSELATTTQGVQVEPYLRHTATDGYGTFSYLAAGTDLSSVYVPGGVSWRNLDFERKRLGIASTLQWRPDDDTTVTLQYLRSEYRMSWLEHAAMFADSSEYLLPDWGTQFSYSADGVFEKGSPISYIYSGDGSVKFTTDARYAEQKTVTQDISLGFERYLTDHTILSADAQLVRSWSSQYDLTVASSTFLSGVGYDLTGEYPTLTVSDSSAVTSSSNYYWNWAMDHFAQNQGRELALRLDLEHDFDDQFVRKIKFGVRSTDRNQTNKSTPYNWNYLSETWDSSGTAGLDSYLAGSSSLYSFGNFFRGQVNVPTSLWFPSTSLVKNYAAAVAALESFASSWSAVDTYDLQYINRQKERTQAAYAIAYFGSDEISTPIDGNFGVRVVQTSTKADGYGNYPDFSGYTASDLGDLAYLKTQFTGQYFPIEGGTQYTNVLPSFNLRVKFTNDLQWRFAVSKAVSRPDMDKLTANMFLYANTTTGSDGNVTVTSWTGTAGNPNLKPMRANQVDTALEWYFDNTDMMYLTLFYKDVRDYIATQTRTETYDGVDFSISRPYNMSHGYIRGAEWGYTQFFDSLPGFLSGLGVSANYTYVDSKGSPVELLTPVTKAESGVYATLPLEGLSKRSYNAALIYEKYDFSFRLAYNWRSRYLLTTSDANVGLPMWSDDFGQLDASLFYNINSHLKVGLQATNITDAVTKVLMGPSGYSDGEIDSRLYSRGWFINDRRYSLVLRMNW